MGEAKNRAEEIQAEAHARAAQAQQNQIFAAMAKMPAIFVNGWAISSPNGLLKLSLVELPGADIPIENRFCSVMSLETAEALGQAILSNAAQIKTFMAQQRADAAEMGKFTEAVLGETSGDEQKQGQDAQLAAAQTDAA
jgi:hypothetical protein